MGRMAIIMGIRLQEGMVTAVVNGTLNQILEEVEGMGRVQFPWQWECRGKEALVVGRGRPVVLWGPFPSASASSVDWGCGES